jgi:hypothetical protein
MYEIYIYIYKYTYYVHIRSWTMFEASGVLQVKIPGKVWSIWQGLQVEADLKGLVSAKLRIL